MSAVGRPVDNLDQLIARDSSCMCNDCHLPLPNIDIDIDDALDLSECLLDRVAALLSDQAMDFEEEGVGIRSGPVDCSGKPDQD